MKRTHLLNRSIVVAAALGILSAPVTVMGEEPLDKPVKGFALEEALKDTDRPPRSGVVLETPKAEVVEKDGKTLLRVQWRIKYAGPRWPLIILEPSLTRPAFRGTKVLVIAKGKSREDYATVLVNPPWNPFERNPVAPKDWFLTVPKEKGKAEGVLEADLAEVKRRLLKYYPDEFDPAAAPELYVRMVHDVTDRGDEVDLDAWTGHLLATPVKVANAKW